MSTCLCTCVCVCECVCVCVYENLFSICQFPLNCIHNYM